MPPKPSILIFKTAKTYLTELGGDNAIKLVGLCERKRKCVSDEVIGKKMRNLKITEIRALLNKLHFKGIACYNKKKDSRSGWYSYTWEIKPGRIAELVIEKQAERVNKLEKTISFEADHDFFTCKKGCDQFAFEIAAEYTFKCPICGNSMDLIDNEKRIKKVKREIRMIKKELEGMQLYL